MGLEGGKRDPSPMDWIWNTRSYGMKIRYATTADGKVGWDGETILDGKIEYSMTQLRNATHGLVSKAGIGLMKELMLVEMNIDNEVNKGQVPPIHWVKLRDNPVESQVGWSFLQDPRNRFEVEGPWWLWNRVFQDARFGRNSSRPINQTIGSSGRVMPFAIPLDG